MNPNGASGFIELMMRCSTGYLRKRVGFNTTGLIGTWCYLTITYAGDRNVVNLKIYLNSGLQSATLSDNTLSGGDVLVSAIPFQISAYNGGSTAATNTDIDEVVVWSSMLDQAYINSRYVSGAGTEVIGNANFIATIKNYESVP